MTRETENLWNDLIPSSNRLLPTAAVATTGGGGGTTTAIIDINNQDLDTTPHSTVNTEAGKQFTYTFRNHNGFGKHFNNDDSFNGSMYKCIKQSRLFAGRIRKRVVHKNGSVNLSKERVEKRSQRYLQDTFTTMVDIQWRWNLLVFSMGFVLSWLGFAIIWYIIAYAHGDFENDETKHRKCVNGVDSFSTAFLFSIETQHTIGYGSRYTNEECPEAIFVMCVQSITGVMIQCFVVGFVFAKLSRPKKRSQTLMFSRNAVICLRDGKMCLMFRLGDVRNRSHIIGAAISALVIDRKITLEGEVIPYYHNQLKVRFDNSDTQGVFLVWPATIVHEVDSSSPFWGMSADDLAREKFEIVVILEGTVESTGQSIQARSSYLPCEVLWGHRFEQVVAYRKDTGQYRVDYSKFNNTYEVEMRTCSARDYYEYHMKYVNSSSTALNKRFTSLDLVSKASNEDKEAISYADSGVCNATNSNYLTTSTIDNLMANSNNLTVTTINSRYGNSRS
ncbi:G protein-activated inward rectifier potassium channel 3-like [Brevipalpus obovatus]|uniref:G protein-activated inward rectifier potassium channel 3-like n=1 Tax=Brevipalpus obovatus TaxID=246614 RepID=UPI003D9E9C0D